MDIDQRIKLMYDDEDAIHERLDNEVMEWVDREDDDFDGDDWEWYQEYRNGEAEDVVRGEMVVALKKYHPNMMDRDIDKAIREAFEFLDV